MNKYNIKKLRLPIRLKGWKDKKLVLDTFKWKKSAIRQVIEANSCSKWYLKVTYGKGKTNFGIEKITNEGDYFNKRDLLKALSIFTSKTEINDYLNNYELRN